MQLQELVEKAKGGDQQAFGELYDLFAEKIFRFIKIKIRDQQEAEDILQETFVKAWRALKNLEMKGLNFSAWLYAIARNGVNDFYRKKYRQPEIAELNEEVAAVAAVAGGGAEEEVDRQYLSQAMEKCFELLPDQYKEILEMRFVQDFSTEETAKILGKSNLSVRLAQHRALKKLKIILEQNYDF